MQAGMLQALYERGILPDLLVGTSAGALNAAFIATRPQTVETARQLAEVWRGLRREDIFPISPRVVLGGLTNHRNHLVSDSGLRGVASRYLKIARLEDADIPLHLVSLDLLTGRELRLSTGSALDALLAATAIPGILPPVRRGGQLLVDGGVVNNTPISHAVELGAQRIYALETYDPVDLGMAAAPRGALDAAVQGITMLIAARDRANLSRQAGAAELTVLPAANHQHLQPTDFDHADQLIRQGLASARRVLSSTFPVTPEERRRTESLV